MVSYNNYIAGWLDSSIYDFFASLPRAFASVKHALITSLDSNLDPASLLERNGQFRLVREEARPVGKGLLLPTSALLRDDLYKEVFFGFDEVWLFPEEINDPKPDGAWIVGPGRIDQEAMNKLGPWMSDNSCSLAFGDGSGLNLIVKAQGLIKHLLAHTLEKHEPATTVDFEPAVIGQALA